MSDGNNQRMNRKKSGSCCPPGSRLPSFMQPWLLLLLSQGSAHGYELMERLTRDDDLPGIDPGLLYRTLRQFEEDGLVLSSWATEGSGPARRIYEITQEGIEFLHAWAVNVASAHRRLGRFLKEYEKLNQGGEK